jgi:hypothetical protein
MATLGNKVVLFGGATTDPSTGNPTSILGDTWSWDGTTWTEEHPATSPPARESAAMARLGDTLVLFGGADANGALLGDTWTWDGVTWTQHTMTPAPSARGGHAMASMP